MIQNKLYWQGDIFIKQSDQLTLFNCLKLLVTFFNNLHQFTTLNIRRTKYSNNISSEKNFNEIKIIRILNVKSDIVNYLSENIHFTYYLLIDTINLKCLSFTNLQNYCLFKIVLYGFWYMLLNLSFY